jgi:hypothetical protein
MLALCLASVVYAAGDVVLLENGDRVTGEIQKLANGKLSLKTAYAGTLQIDWKQVVSVESPRQFKVEADNGWRTEGLVERSGPTVDIVQEGARISLRPEALVSASPIPERGEEPTFLQELDGVFDLGYNLVRGNSTLNQSSLRLLAGYRTDTMKVEIDLGSLFAEQDGAETTSRHNANLRLDRFVSPRLFFFGLAGGERDDRRRLNLRTSLGGGLGWKLVRNRQREFSILGGLNYINEQFRVDAASPDPLDSSGEGQFTVEWREVTFAGAELTSRLSVTPNIVDLGRYRISLESGARLPIITRYVWSLSFFQRFDSKPPVEALKNDFGVVSSLGVRF